MRRGRLFASVGVAAVIITSSSCNAARNGAATPFPSQQPVSEMFAGLPSTSPSTSASPSAQPVTTGTPSRGATSASPSHPSTASSKVYCPSGRVAAEVDDVRISDSGDAPSPNGDRHWNVSVAGTATNGASAAVRAVRLSVTVHASGGRARSVDVNVGQTIAAGASAPWSTQFQYRSADKPQSDASVAVTGWTWADSSLAVCPT